MKKLTDYPNLVKEWHPTKNKDLNLSKLTYGSKKKAWWIGECGHVWQSRINNRTSRNTGCHYCNCGKNDLPLSKTHPHLILEWHPEKNNINPNIITAGQHFDIWWLGKCGHEWKAPLHNRTKPTKPSNCPFCTNRSTDDSNSLKTKNPDVAEEWHPCYNDVSPDKVNYKSYKKAWWLGKCGHEWQTLVRIRTRKLRPAGCPICRDSKGELKIRQYLKKNNILFEEQVRFVDCKDKKPLPFDFKVGNVLIEFQGIQHYEPINFGGDYLKIFEDLKKHDVIKKSWCVKNNFQLLEISYKDFDNIELILEKEV